MTYLGMPLGAHYKDPSIWNSILEKMERRLSRWKQLYLSKGSKLILLKSTLSSFPTFFLNFLLLLCFIFIFLSLFTIPQAVTTRLEKIQRNFLWETSDEVFKYSLVVWEKVCLSMEEGGLGITRVGLFNQALLGKWLWRFGREDHRLWRQVIATKYGVDSGGWCTRDVRGTHGCGLWKNIRARAESFFRQVEYAVGEGHCIRFWYDPRSGPIPLKDLYPDLFACAVSKETWIYDLVVSNLEGGNGSWNLQFC